LLARLDHLPSDTGKVQLLIDLSHYYWYVGKAGNLDTCLDLAQRAYELGVLLHDNTDAAEAVFILITGLVAQLHGACTIENDGGVAITIHFRPRRKVIS